MGYRHGFFLVEFFHSLELRIQLGRWSWVAGAPQVHRIHHSRLPQHADKNFAAYFPIWDVLFGTYWHPREGRVSANRPLLWRKDRKHLAIVGLAVEALVETGVRAPTRLHHLAKVHVETPKTD